MNRKLSNKKSEKGQGLVEYALILVLVAIVVIGALMVLGPIIGNSFSTVNNSLTSVSGGGCPAGQHVHNFGDGVWCTDNVSGQPIGNPLP
jgi:pilus assembly protein Flp/PilA